MSKHNTQQDSQQSPMEEFRYICLICFKKKRRDELQENLICWDCE